MKSRTAQPIPPSKGIRGAVKNRIVKDMLEAVQGNFKVLIVDNAAAEILSAAMKMHELVDHGVPLVEMLTNVRQPLPTSPAIYFISPTATSVEIVIRDWGVKNPYSEANVFFTSTAPEVLMQNFKGTRIVNSLRNMKDLLLDFHSPESQMFSFELKYDLPAFFGSSVMASRQKLDQASAQLVSVLQTLGESDPVIRFQDTEPCRAVATAVQGMIGIVAKGMAGASTAMAGEAPATVLVVDRSVDVPAVILHELTYQAMLQDVMPPTNNIYTQTYKDRSGKDATRSCVLDEEDPVWFKYRHTHIAGLLSGLSEDMKKLLEDNPGLAGGMGAGAGLAQLGEAVRQLPKFQEQQGKLSLHIDIAERLMKIFTSQNLKDVCDLEQRIVTGETGEGAKLSFKDLYKDLLLMMKGPLPRPVKHRLLMLMAATQGSQLTKEKRDELMMAGKLGAEESQQVEMLQFFGVAKAAAEKKPVKLGKPKENVIDLSRYEPKLKGLVDALMKDTLPEKEYPSTKPGKTSSTPTATAGGKSLRTGAAPKFSAAITGGGVKSSDKQLDLGHGKKINLTTTSKVVVCVLGGITYSEMRSMYELIEENHREIVFGGSSVLSTQQFLDQLPVIS